MNLSDIFPNTLYKRIMEIQNDFMFILIFICAIFSDNLIPESLYILFCFFSKDCEIKVEESAGYIPAGD